MPNIKSMKTIVMEFEEDGTFKEASGRRNIRTDQVFANRDENIQIAYHFSVETIEAQPPNVRAAMTVLRNAFSVMADAVDDVRP